MRILVIVSRDSGHPGAGGGDRHLTQLARGLAELGNQVTILTASHPTLPKQEHVGNVTIIRLAPSRCLFIAVWARLVFGFHGRFDVVIEEAIGGERAPFLSKLLSGSPTIQFWYQDNRPLFAASYGRLGAAIGGSLQRILLWVNRSGFALGNSEATRTWIVTQGFASERTAVSYPKVDVSSAPQNPMQFETRPDRFISIGNFRPLKRFEEAIETLVRLRKDNPRAELALVGRQADADYLGRLRALAAEQAVGRHVRFVVDASDKEKFQLLSESKVLTIHSPIEGFGWTIPEAGLCGVPVVGNPGVPMDSLREGVNGTRVPFGDVEAYARVVNQLFSDREVWVGYSVRAREVALEFARNRVESDVLSLLKRCIGRSSEAEDPGDE